MVAHRKIFLPLSSNGHKRSRHECRGRRARPASAWRNSLSNGPASKELGTTRVPARLCTRTSSGVPRFCVMKGFTSLAMPLTSRWAAGRADCVREHQRTRSAGRHETAPTPRSRFCGAPRRSDQFLKSGARDPRTHAVSGADAAVGIAHSAGRIPVDGLSLRWQFPCNYLRFSKWSLPAFNYRKGPVSI